MITESFVVTQQVLGTSIKMEVSSQEEAEYISLNLEASESILKTLFKYDEFSELNKCKSSETIVPVFNKKGLVVSLICKNSKEYSQEFVIDCSSLKSMIDKIVKGLKEDIESLKWIQSKTSLSKKNLKDLHKELVSDKYKLAYFLANYSNI